MLIGMHKPPLTDPGKPDPFFGVEYKTGLQTQVAEVHSVDPTWISGLDIYGCLEEVHTAGHEVYFDLIRLFIGEGERF